MDALTVAVGVAGTAVGVLLGIGLGWGSFGVLGLLLAAGESVYEKIEVLREAERVRRAAETNNLQETGR